MSIAKKLPMSVAAVVATVLLSGPTFSQPSMAATFPSVQADADSSSVDTVEPDGKICLCAGDHCICVTF
jgi:hypothetical protein